MDPMFELNTSIYVLPNVFPAKNITVEYMNYPTFIGYYSNIVYNKAVFPNLFFTQCLFRSSEITHRLLTDKFLKIMLV